MQYKNRTIWNKTSIKFIPLLLCDILCTMGICIAYKYYRTFWSSNQIKNKSIEDVQMFVSSYIKKEILDSGL